MKIRLSTLKKLIREAVEEATTCSQCGGMTEGPNCECNQCGMAESDKNDTDGNGEINFADIAMARRIASGESREKAFAATRKHNESVARRFLKI
jgi:hypothetical protein